MHAVHPSPNSIARDPVMQVNQRAREPPWERACVQRPPRELTIPAVEENITI